jgi:hypothetical protein
METESAGAGAATAPVAETRAMRAAVNFILMVGKWKSCKWEELFGWLCEELVVVSVECL